MLDMAWPAPCPDHQDAVGTEVDRWGDGRGLAHRAIAKVMAAAIDLQRDGREHKGNGR